MSALTVTRLLDVRNSLIRERNSKQGLKINKTVRRTHALCFSVTASYCLL